MLSPTTTTADLMRRFCENEEPEAFRELVTRYLPLVYGAAKRRSNGNAALAEDVSQLVFADFAQRMPQLRADDRIGGWLYRAALRRTGDLLKSERRRKRREQQAAAMQEIDRLPQDEAWKALSPVIDNALGELRDTDREVLVLRFFEGMKSVNIARSLNVSEEAAQKRVERALGRLRARLQRAGVSAGGATLAGLMASGSSSEAASIAPLVADKVSRAVLDGKVATTATATSGGLSAMISLPLSGVAALLVLGIGTVPKLVGHENSKATALAENPSGGSVRLTALEGKKSPPQPLSPASLEEIIDELAELLNEPLTALDETRCTILFGTIPPEQVADALKLIKQKWNRTMIARSDQLQLRPQLGFAWARLEPQAAMEWLMVNPPEYRASMDDVWPYFWITALQGWSTRDFEAAWAWTKQQFDAEPVRARILIPALAEGFGNDLVEKLGAQAGLDAMLKMQASNPSSKQQVIGEFTTRMSSNDDFRYLMTVIGSEIKSPSSRSTASTKALGAWRKHDWNGALAWIRELPDQQQQASYGWRLGFPKDLDMNGFDASAHVDWLYSLNPKIGSDDLLTATALLVEVWFPAHPKAAGNWLAEHEHFLIGNLIAGALHIQLEGFHLNPKREPKGWREHAAKLIRAVAQHESRTVESYANPGAADAETQKRIETFLKEAVK